MKRFKIQCLKAQLCALVFSSSHITVYSQCVAFGPNDFSSFSNNTSIGTLAWSNTSNAQLADNNYANAGQLLGLFSTINTNYLVAQGPGYAVPSFATVCGISVDIEESATGLTLGASAKDLSVKIVQNNTISGTEHALAVGWTGASSYATYGSPTDLWGLSWLPADINSAGFGVAIATHLSTGAASLFLTARVDHIRVTVYYDSSSILSSSFRDFEAVKMPRKVNLQWTAAATGASHFIVQKSADSHSWEQFDSIPVIGGPSWIYHSADGHPGPQNYYRIREVDINGQQKGSGILSVLYPGIQQQAITISPNPAHGMARVWSLDKAAIIRSIKVMDLCGRPVQAPCTENTGGVFELNTSNLPPGIYLLKMATQNGAVSSRLVVR